MIKNIIGMKKTLLTYCFALSFLVVSAQSKRETAKPNIVYILLDDAGLTDYGAYGNKVIRTPNIDGLAREGITFNQHYSAASNCSPSRAALLTGRYQVRHGLNDVLGPTSPTGIDPNEITVAERLKEVGYTSGIIGKWHLGTPKQHLPLQNGFDYYFGIPYSNDMTPVFYFRNNDTVKTIIDQRFITRTYTEEAVNFIEKNKENPFFLYLPHNLPHVPLFASPQFTQNSKSGIYGAVIEEIDWSVGKVLQALKDNGLDENTIVIFSSDNGPWKVKEDHAGSSGLLRSEKSTWFEGGFRVPLLVKWPGKVKPGSVYNNITSQLDWFPTLIHAAGAKLPSDRPYDGEDLGKVLAGTAQRKGNQIYYFYSGTLRAYRKGDYKIVYPYDGHPQNFGRASIPKIQSVQLFNLKNDPNETTDIAPSDAKQVQTLVDEGLKYVASLGALPPTRTPR
jgi:arylsulfatase A-like enzyme